MKSNIPIEASVRNWLNGKGFKFVDDGKLSLILNTNPIPLGTLYMEEDYKNMCYKYRQEIISETTDNL